VHITLSCKSLKNGGIAYFKVYPGNRSNKESYTDWGYQSNRQAISYQEEVEMIFGKGNVVVDTTADLIIAYKNSDCVGKHTSTGEHK